MQLLYILVQLLCMKQERRYSSAAIVYFSTAVVYETRQLLE